LGSHYKAHKHSKVKAVFSFGQKVISLADKALQRNHELLFNDKEYPCQWNKYYYVLLDK